MTTSDHLGDAPPGSAFVHRARFGAELVVAALVISLVVNGLGALGGGGEFHGPHVTGD